MLNVRSGSGGAKKSHKVVQREASEEEEDDLPVYTGAPSIADMIAGFTREADANDKKAAAEEQKVTPPS